MTSPRRRTAIRRPSEQSVLSVENLSVDIPLADGVLHAVDNVTLHVDRGETLCIVGESGCGKSLTSLALMDLLPKKAIRTIASLDLNDASILNYSEKQMSDVRGNRMGMIFQEPMTSLNPAFTIGNQMVETPDAIEIYQMLKRRILPNRCWKKLASLPLTSG